MTQQMAVDKGGGVVREQDEDGTVGDDDRVRGRWQRRRTMTEQ